MEVISKSSNSSLLVLHGENRNEHVPHPPAHRHNYTFTHAKIKNLNEITGLQKERRATTLFFMAQL